MDQSDIDLPVEEIPGDVRQELESEAIDMEETIRSIVEGYGMTLEDFIEVGKEIERELEGEGIEFHHTLYRQK